MGEVRPLRPRDDVPESAGKPKRRHDEAERARELMGAAARGDQQAFAGLYDLFAPLLHGIVLRVLRNPAQSEEVTQEVFLEIWRLAPRYDVGKGSVKSWMAAIAHRRAVDRVRSEQSARDREEREHALTPDPVDAIGEAVDDRLQHERVRKAMESLTEVQRTTIELAYFGGNTYREVAVLLGIAEGTAKTRIRDGLIRLRDHLGVEL